jgi:hypothetical protein
MLFISLGYWDNRSAHNIIIYFIDIYVKTTANPISPEKPLSRKCLGDPQAAGNKAVKPPVKLS